MSLRCQCTTQLNKIEELIKELRKELMADFTAFNAALADLQAQLATNETTLAAVGVAVQDLVAAQGTGDQAAVDAATATLQTLTASAVTDAASLATDAAADPGAPRLPPP